MATKFPKSMLVTQQCLTICDLMDCNPPSSSIHGILQERILKWGSIPCPGDLPDPRMERQSPTLQVEVFTVWATSEFSKSNTSIWMKACLVYSSLYLNLFAKQVECFTFHFLFLTCSLGVGCFSWVKQLISFYQCKLLSSTFYVFCIVLLVTIFSTLYKNYKNSGQKWVPMWIILFFYKIYRNHSCICVW